jgi:uncharacterized protein (TIGR02117 family)
MIKRFQRLRKYIIRVLIIILCPVCLIFLYLVYAVGMLFLSVSGKEATTEAKIEIYVHSNGFHTDIMVPAYDTLTSAHWMDRFHEQGLDTHFADCRYIAFGWGNKDFYIESFDKSFPSLATTLKAIFIPDDALMHVEFMDHIPAESARTAKICLTGEQYFRLCNYISSYFTSETGSGKWEFYIAGYGPDDFFYKANGRYHMFHTCNDWTNDGLRVAGATHTCKAPFAENIMLPVRMHPSSCSCSR